MPGKIIVLTDVTFNNPSLPRITLPETVETLAGQVSTVSTTTPAQQYALKISDGLAYSVGSSGTVNVTDLATGVRTALAGGTGVQSQGIAVSGANVYVSRASEGRVRRIAAGVATDFVTGLTNPMGLAIGRLTGQLYVLTRLGQVYRVTVGGVSTLLGSVEQPGCVGLAVDEAAGVAYVATATLYGGTAAVYSFNLATGAAALAIPSRGPGSLWGLALGGKNAKLYLGGFGTDPRVFVWDTRTPGVPPVPLAGRAGTMTPSTNGLGAAAILNNPAAVAFGQGALYVANADVELGLRMIR